MTKSIASDLIQFQLTSDIWCGPLTSGLLPPLLRLMQPLRHFLVMRSVVCPTLGGTVPTIILDGHIDASVDEELHGLVIGVKHQLMQDAGGLVGGSVCVCFLPLFWGKKQNHR